MFFDWDRHSRISFFLDKKSFNKYPDQTNNAMGYNRDIICSVLYNTCEFIHVPFRHTNKKISQQTKRS